MKALTLWQHLTDFAVIRRVRQQQRQACTDASISSSSQIVAAAVYALATFLVAAMLVVAVMARTAMGPKAQSKLTFPIIQYSLVSLVLLSRFVLALLYYTDTTSSVLLLSAVTVIPIALMTLIFSLVMMQLSSRCRP